MQKQVGQWVSEPKSFNGGVPFSCPLALTLADLGYLRMQLTPGIAGGLALFTFFTSSLFIPFSPFSTCSETTAAFLLPIQILKIHVLFLECGLNKNCILFCFYLHRLFLLMMWSLVVLVDEFSDSVMNLLPPCSLLVCLSSLLCLVFCLSGRAIWILCCSIYLDLELGHIWFCYVLRLWSLLT